MQRVETNGRLVNAASGRKLDILIQIPNGAVKTDSAQALKISQDDGEEMEEDR